jgi:NADH:ubiquinone oxidoreductase subunit E
MTNDQVRIESILADSPGGKASLVEILLEIRAQTGTVTEEAVRIVSERLGIGVIDVHGVASFFNGFERRPLEERFQKKSSKTFDPWREPPCILWSCVR